MEPYDCQPVTLFEIGVQEEGQPAAMPGDQPGEQPDAKPEEPSVQDVPCRVKPGSKPAEKPEFQPGPKPDEEHDGPAEPDVGVAAGDVSCAISMHSMDAQTISWASQGGIAPMELIDCQLVTTASFEIGDKVEEQPAAKPGDQQEAKPDGVHPGAKQGIQPGVKPGGEPAEETRRGDCKKEKQDLPKEHAQLVQPDHHAQQEPQPDAQHAQSGGQIWVRGAEESDNARYRKFLCYMEERREETRVLLKETELRKERAKEKEARWELLRECMNFLKENSKRWQERKLKECERVREEAKEDRLAVVRMKKKRYGIKTMSKEENVRFKEMSERKVLLAKARGNLWKLTRDPRCSMEEKEKEA